MENIFLFIYTQIQILLTISNTITLTILKYQTLLLQCVQYIKNINTLNF